MRERIQVESIRCERCVSKIAEALAPLRGINEARIELGMSAVVVDYDEPVREDLDAALTGAGFEITGREPA